MIVVRFPKYVHTRLLTCHLPTRRHLPQRGQLPPLRGRHPEERAARGDPGGGAQGDGGRGERDRVPERRRQEQEPRLRLRAVHVPPRGGGRAPQAHTGARHAVRPADRGRLGGAGARGRRGRDGDGEGAVRAQPHVEHQRRAHQGI